MRAGCVGVDARTPFVFTADGPWTASSMFNVHSSHQTSLLTVPYHIPKHKLYETIKHATTTDQFHATCYGLRSPLADCDRSTRRAQAIGSLLGPAARLGYQRRINDPAEVPKRMPCSVGVLLPSRLSVCSLHSAAVSAPHSVLSRANVNARLRTANHRGDGLACLRLLYLRATITHPRATGDLANRFCCWEKPKDGHAAGGLRFTRRLVDSATRHTSHVPATHMVASLCCSIALGSG